MSHHFYLGNNSIKKGLRIFLFKDERLLLFKRYIFKPKLLPTLLTIILIVIFVSLGRWQLHRYTEKKYWQESFNTRSHLSPLTIDQLAKKSGDILYYPLRVSGYFVNSQQILLDNKVDQGRIGYHVLTVFLPDNSKKALLINRGWIPLGKSRAELPEIAPVTQHCVLQGIITLPAAHPFILGNLTDNPQHWPLRAEALDLSAFAKLTRQELYPFVLQLNPDQPFGFVRTWTIPLMNPYQSLSYAWQWFAFAIVLFIIYIARSMSPMRHQDE